MSMRSMVHAAMGTGRGVPACVLAMAMAAGAAGQVLNDEIERAIGRAKFSTDRVGVSVLALGQGTAADTVLADVQASRPMIPASNQKVLTSGVALLVLGADYQFKTEFHLVGDKLVVKAGGDPAFADPVLLERSKSKLTVPDLLTSIAQAIKKAGVGEVSEIVIDDRVFDRVGHHPSWAKRHLDEAYCPEVSGLNFHANVISFFPAPGRTRGQPASIKLEPQAGFVEVDNTAKTAGAREPNSVRAERLPGDFKFKIRGDVAQALVEPLEIPLTDNSKFFGMVLAEELERAGVRVGIPGARRGAQAVRLVETEEVFESPRVLAIVTTPIADVLTRCNTNSMNLYAEALLKLTGHKVTNEPGSWRNGPEVVRMYLSQRLGPEFAASTTIVDGSGLSDDNRVTPATLTRWLDAMASDPAGKVYIDSFADERSPSARLRRMGRMGLKSKLQCKTGHINGVLSLSGYLTDAAGSRVAFSIIYNDSKSYKGAEAVDMQEDIVKAIDTWMNRKR